MERHVPEHCDWAQKNNGSGTPYAVRHLRRGLLVPGRPAAALDRRQRAVPACRTLHTKVRRNQEWLQLLGGGNETSWSGRASVGLRDLWKTGRWLRDLVTTGGGQMDSAARMLSDDGEPSWNECC